MAFTSLAIIDIVSTPANTLLGILPEAASVIAAFDRIQTYLLNPDREDKREILDNRYARNDSNSHATSTSGDTLGRTAIHINHATIRPAWTADPVLRNISTSWKEGDLVVVSGAVGTGKTTLAKAVLGDLPPDSGIVQTAHGSIAYCSQTAWLINGTVKEVIYGPPSDDNAFDEEWYRRVLYVCDLDEDLDQLPDGDQTVIGSRGITLSGGQKQRVVSAPFFGEFGLLFLTWTAKKTLARAVYARRNFIILDDVLSALDATTERHIVRNLMGANGLFKELGTTVLLITHASKLF